MERWLPPIEARPEGTGGLAPAPGRRPSAVTASWSALVALMIAGVIALRLLTG